MFDKEMDECSDSYVSFVLEKMNEMKEESKDEVEFFMVLYTIKKQLF